MDGSLIRLPANCKGLDPVSLHRSLLLFSPGKYLAIDCEMVGIAGDSSKPSLEDRSDESSLARVSVVNYYGAVQLDVFVRQRERVTDWRTAVSGVRESDMAHGQ